MITIEKCCCGHKGCTDYWLVGLGKFMQGSGFTKQEAETIAKLWNEKERGKMICPRDKLFSRGSFCFRCGSPTIPNTAPCLNCQTHTDIRDNFCMNCGEDQKERNKTILDK